MVYGWAALGKGLLPSWQVLPSWQLLLGNYCKRMSFGSHLGVIYYHHLGVIWELSGGHLGDIWESVGIILPIGMIYPTSPPNHPGLGTGMR